MEQQQWTAPAQDSQPSHDHHEPQSPMPEQKKGGKGRIIAAIIIVLIGVLVYRATSEAPAPEATDGDKMSETMMEEHMDEGSMMMGKTETLLPDAFEGRAVAEQIINSTQGKNGATAEKIVYGVVTDDETAGQVYFATADGNTQGNFVGIYRYDEENKRWWRMLKRTYAPEDGLAPKQLHVLAKDGRNLILRETRINDPRHVCDSYWVGGPLYTMNLDNPLEGFQEYTASDATLEMAKQEESVCRGA